MSTYFLSFPNHKVTLNVLIENITERYYTATVLGLPDCRAEGETRQQALARLRDCVTARLVKAEVVPMEIERSDSPHPWLKFAGMFKDDPQFDEVLADIQVYRRELDAEIGAYDRVDMEDEAM